MRSSRQQWTTIARCAVPTVPTVIWRFQLRSTLIMVALWNRADHYIFMLWFVLLLSFFARLISAAADWMSAILPHMVWP